MDEDMTLILVNKHRIKLYKNPLSKEEIIQGQNLDLIECITILKLGYISNHLKGKKKEKNPMAKTSPKAS